MAVLDKRWTADGRRGGSPHPPFVVCTTLHLQSSPCIYRWGLIDVGGVRFVDSLTSDLRPTEGWAATHGTCTVRGAVKPTEGGAHAERDPEG
jgi:hypothetical protein